MTNPVRITSGLFSVRFRDDMPRTAAITHWQSHHADLMRGMNHVSEYFQQQFSDTDHGYWPTTPTVGTTVPVDFRLDGFAEIRFAGLLSSIRSALQSSEILRDEQNLFRHVVGQLTAPGGGRWWPMNASMVVAHRTAVLLRRRAGVSRRAFNSFIHDDLAPALHREGALDLRSYVFIPSSKIANNSPAVSHAYPVERRFHAGLLIGGHNRDDTISLLESPEVTQQVMRQAEFISAAYAYTVERSECIIDNVSRRDP